MYGALCVMMDGMMWPQQLCVGSWDTHMKVLAVEPPTKDTLGPTIIVSNVERMSSSRRFLNVGNCYSKDIRECPV